MNDVSFRSSGPQNRRTWGQRFVLTVNLLGVLAALGMAWTLRYSYAQAASVDRVQLGGTLTPKPTTESGQRVFNLLLVGYDSAAGLDPDDPIQVGRQGERFSDVIIVAHIDQGSGEAALLSIPRDLWLPIAGLDREQKINYAFGVGGPAVLVDTIEAELDIPIHHYASVDFAGFQGLIDVVGSVDVYFERPARDWNAHPATGAPRSQTGFEMLHTGCQSLDPPAALAYVRSRYYQEQLPDGSWVDSDPPSDLGRIVRQQDFLRRLIQRSIDRGARNPFVLSDLVDAGLDHVTIDQDLTPQLLVDVGRTFRDFEPGELQTYSFPTRFGWEGTASVLYEVDDESEAILEIFRGVSPADPRTVAVSVVADPGAEQIGEDVVAQLAAAGFDVDGAMPGETGSGLIIRHGADGLQAAEVVNGSLGGGAVLEQIPTLAGRTVIVVVGPLDVTEGHGTSPEGEIDSVPGDGSPQSPATSQLEASPLQELDPDSGSALDLDAEPDAVQAGCP